MQIGVDGAHLKGHHGGTMLSTIALDGNNQLFLVAQAIVYGEDQETQKFTVGHLKIVLKESGMGDKKTFILDRKQVLMQTLNHSFNCFYDLKSLTNYCLSMCKGIKIALNE